MDNEKLVAACGLYCGACEIYRTQEDGNQAKTKEIMNGMNTRGGTSFTLDDMKCDGCAAGGKINTWCKGCGIRACAKQKQKNARCSPECPDYPCSLLIKFANDGMTHHKEIIENLQHLNKDGLKKHAAQEEKRWRCSGCGKPMSWYDKQCSSCGALRSEKLFKLEYDWPPK